MHRFYYPSCGLQKTVYGLAFYVRESILNQNLQEKNVWYFTGYIWAKVDYFNVLILTTKTSTMCAQNILTQLLCRDLLGKPLVLVGDFNIDVQTTPGTSFKLFMIENFGLRYLHTSVTTDYGSIIDHMYTSIPLFDIISWGTLETYYSDHKPFFVSLK